MADRHAAGATSGRVKTDPAGIAAAQMDEVFPFRLCLDRDLRIAGTGAGLAKTCPELVPGLPFGERLRLITPDLPLNYAAIREQRFTVFFIEYLPTKLVLKGQMLPVDEGTDTERLLFLCSPVVRDMGSVSELGLTLKDFAIHDSVVDFLVLLQTKINTLNDVRKMAERLKKEVAVRREAEADLKSINEELETRVARRTQELRQANRQLQHEVSERKRADEELRGANARLKAWVATLERHNREISILNRMGDMLQACRRVEETYRVIADSVQQLFPADGGQLMLVSDLDGSFDVVAAWGGIAPDGTAILRDDCWALRRARPHWHDPGADTAHCRHFDGDTESGYLCAPLLAQGELLGMLHLRCAGHACHETPDAGEEVGALESHHRLVQTATEHIGLAIANLRLQETLRYQSVRDALTGLYNRRHMEEALEREIHRALRHSIPLGVILLDVDHFKRFNDTQGHQAGDRLLAELGGLLQSHVRGEDIACRYGGEEFILILPGAALEQTRLRAEQLRERVEHHLHLRHDGRDLPGITISAGVAALGAEISDAAALVAAADRALYAAKRGGRNRVVAMVELAENPPD